MQVYEKDGVTLTLSCDKQSDSGVTVTLTASNSTDSDISSFTLQAAVPKVRLTVSDKIALSSDKLTNKQALTFDLQGVKKKKKTPTAYDIVRFLC